MLLVPSLLPRLSRVFIRERFTHLSGVTILVRNMKKNGRRFVKRKLVLRRSDAKRTRHKFHFAPPQPSECNAVTTQTVIKSQVSIR